ncbi:unnamed protein product [Ceutorhynchus assimilis]|uniref:Uncharacterized protein n=1 Tax=Ceutorhynchus assimilis TaxID=467358 RepID=A0A9N9QLI8_9CUCU|nr:unnamed protein product [Ceutorhynchus assimilis]
MRGRVEGNRFTINGPQQKRSSNFKNNLNNTYFKEALVRFLCEHWNQDHMSPYFGDRTVLVNYEKCFKFEVIDNKVVRTVEEDLLCSEHLEAESKIMFHVCELNFDAHVTIRCSDKDIIVIMLGNMHSIIHNLHFDSHRTWK